MLRSQADPALRPLLRTSALQIIACSCALSSWLVRCCIQLIEAANRNAAPKSTATTLDLHHTARSRVSSLIRVTNRNRVSLGRPKFGETSYESHLLWDGPGMNSLKTWKQEAKFGISRGGLHLIDALLEVCLDQSLAAI